VLNIQDRFNFLEEANGFKGIENALLEKVIKAYTVQQSENHGCEMLESGLNMIELVINNTFTLFDSNELGRRNAKHKTNFSTPLQFIENEFSMFKGITLFENDFELNAFETYIKHNDSYYILRNKNV